MGRPASGKRRSMSNADPAFVLDNSVVMAWSFEDEANPYADTVLDAFQASRAIVPTLWPLEVANALLVGERRKRITQADSLRWVQILGALPIAIDDATNRHVWTLTLSLARDQVISAYDAAYLELAVRLNLPLATLDKKLKDAATAVGVSLFGLH